MKFGYFRRNFGQDYVKCRECGYESGTSADFRTLNIAIRPFGGTPITSVRSFD